MKKKRYTYRCTKVNHHTMYMGDLEAFCKKNKKTMAAVIRQLLKDAASGKVVRRDGTWYFK